MITFAWFRNITLRVKNKHTHAVTKLRKLRRTLQAANHSPPVAQAVSIHYGVTPFNAPAGGDPPANIRENFTSPETRGNVIPDAENRTIVSSFVWTKQRNVTEGQTDGQTESL